MNAAKRVGKLYRMGKEKGKWIGVEQPHHIRGRIIRAFYRAVCGVWLTHRFDIRSMKRVG